MDLPEVDESFLSCMSSDSKQKLEKQDSGFHTMSFKNSNYVLSDGSELSDENQARERARLRSLIPAVPPSGKADRFSRGSSLDSIIEASLACYSGNRRQSQLDGSKEERKSLLAEDNTVGSQASGHSSCDSNNDQGSTEDLRMNDLSSTNSAYDDKSDIHPSDNASSSSDFGFNPLKEVEKVDRVSPSPSFDGRVRARILKRELRKIKEELSALGELEMEVSYV